MNKFLSSYPVMILSIAIAYAIFSLSGYQEKVPITQKVEIAKQIDTIYIDSFLIPFPVQVPIIEIPHPKHGRMIVNLNDSTIILTASGISLVDFKDQDMINKYLYQQFDGKNINRKGE